MDQLRRRALLAGAVNVTAYLAVAFGRFRFIEPMRPDPPWVGDLRIAWLAGGGPLLAGLSLGWARACAGSWLTLPQRAPLVTLLALPPLLLAGMALAEGDTLGFLGVACGVGGLLYGLRRATSGAASRSEAVGEGRGDLG